MRQDRQTRRPPLAGGWSVRGAEGSVARKRHCACNGDDDAKWYLPTTQDERWNKRYQDVMDFMEKNHRNPSRHRLEEHDMLNWVKQQRKLKNKGELKAERAEMLERLLSLLEEYRRVNQYC